MCVIQYSYYCGVYGGTAIEEKDWLKPMREACVYIDEITYGRLRHLSVIPEDVQLAVCAVADVIHGQNSAFARLDTAAGIKSFNNDGYSETLADAVQLSDSFARRKADAAATYLPRSHPLRYAGIH